MPEISLRFSASKRRAGRLSVSLVMNQKRSSEMSTDSPNGERLPGSLGIGEAQARPLGERVIDGTQTGGHRAVAATDHQLRRLGRAAALARRLRAGTCGWRSALRGRLGSPFTPSTETILSPGLRAVAAG